MPKSVHETVNLFDLKLQRNIGWDTVEDNSVILRIPKFTNAFVVKWFVPMLKRPTIGVKLDPHGSFFWRQCDGNSTVMEIAERMNTEFGDSFDPKFDRTTKFIQMLLKDKFLMIGG